MLGRRCSVRIRPEEVVETRDPLRGFERFRDIAAAFEANITAEVECLIGNALDRFDFEAVETRVRRVAVGTAAWILPMAEELFPGTVLIVDLFDAWSGCRMHRTVAGAEAIIRCDAASWAAASRTSGGRASGP